MSTKALSDLTFGCEYFVSVERAGVGLVDQLLEVAEELPMNMGQQSC